MTASAKITLVVAMLMCTLALSGCDLMELADTPPAPPPTLSLAVTDSAFHLGDLVYEESWDSYELDYGTYPSIDGDEGCLPLARAFAKFHLKLSDKDLSSFVNFSGDPMLYFSSNTYGAQTSLQEQGVEMVGKPTDLVLFTAPSEDDYAEAKENGTELLVEPIALDAAVLYVSRENPVDSLTQEQIRGIYTGAITNWKEVGGDDLSITAYQDGDREGRKALIKRIMRDVPFAEGPKSEQTIPSGIPGGSSYTVSYNAKFDNAADAIGYGVLALRKDMEGVKILAVDGVSPDAEAIQSGAYPLTVTYYVILRAKDRDGLGGKFMDWILSEEGRRCIEDAGYVLHDKAPA